MTRYSVRIANCIFSIIIFSMLSGCGAQSPEEVVASYYIAAFVDRDSEKAKTYTTGTFAGMNSMMEAALAAAPSPTAEGEKPNVKDMAEMLTSTVEGDTAKVWFEGADFIKYELVKEGGKWKISNIDMSMPDMGELMEQFGQQ